MYISERFATDPNYGATKLNKVLFLSDFWAYAHTGKPITGVEYMKLPFGPAPRIMLPVRNKMEKDGDLAIQEVSLNPEMARKRPINLRSADLSRFTAEEIAWVDKVIELCKSSTGIGLSRYTHEWHGWIAAEDQETIPYETVFISDSALTPFEIERGRQLAKKHGWPI